MTDAELRDAAIEELKKTTVGYVNKNWKTPPAGTRWANALHLLAQIGVATPQSSFPAFGISCLSDMSGWGQTNIRRALTDIASLGAKYVRQDFPWSAIEPTEGKFAWSGYDVVVQEAVKVGVSPILILGYTPAWANGGHADKTYGPADPAKYAEFCATAAARYAPMGVTVFEIWNEPNIPQYWKPAPSVQAYAACLKAAYTSIKKVAPSVTVLTGGTSPSGPATDPPTWLKGLYANGAKGYFDGVSDHPYIDDDGFIWKWLDGLHQIMVANGDAAKKIWATEVGCSPNKVGGDAEVVRRQSEFFSKWKALDYAAALCWFTYWDPNVYGMVDGNWQPRPTYNGFKTAVAD